LTKQCEENGEELAKLNKQSDSVLKELQKRRQKLADAYIFDNFKLRTEELNEIDTKNKAIDGDLKVLEKIITEANKITPANASATNAQLK
jgi:ribosomal protein S18